MKRCACFLTLLLLISIVINAQDLILRENFFDVNGDGVPEGWSLIDNDGDGNNWYYLYDYSSWLAGPDGRPGIMTSASSNGKYALTPDNWLVSPRIDGAKKVIFYVSVQDDRFQNEVLALMASKKGRDVGDFTLVSEETIKAVQASDSHFVPDKERGNWYEYDRDLPEGTKYIAFRHYKSHDLFRVNIDDVSVYGVIPAGIDGVNERKPDGRGNIFTLSGVRLGQPLDALPNGVYIVNGKKKVKI